LTTIFRTKQGLIDEKIYAADTVVNTHEIFSGAAKVASRLALDETSVLGISSGQFAVVSHGEK